MGWRTESTGRGRELRVFEPGNDGGAAYMRFGRLLGLWNAEGREIGELPIGEIVSDGEGGLRMAGASELYEAEARWKADPEEPGVYDVTLRFVYKGEAPAEFGLTFGCELIGPGRPDWMIPGAFYKENRFEKNLRMYPRYDYRGGKHDEMVSDYWSFRSDRAALPAVFTWNDGACGALCTDEMSELGLTGIGFRGNEAGTAIWLDYPYREEPVTFVGDALPRPADIVCARFEPGQQATLKLNVYAAGADPHAYDPFVRRMYRLHGAEHRLNPWMGLGEAAELTAHGLYTWHYDAEEGILNETAAFDREFNNNVKGMGDRRHMHVGWVSGAPYAYALLAYGRKKGIAAYAEAGAAVLDKIASGVSPSGIFWASWVAGKGWTAGWNPKSDWLQARTIAEATLFMTRALAFERERGVAHPEWEAAVSSNLNFAASRQREDGNFGSYYNCRSGEVEEWDGAGGMLWISALLAGAAYFEEKRYSEAAVLAGGYYETFIKDEYIYGAPEDVHLTPTSEDAYNAVASYVHLYEFDRSPGWLALASSAADWMMTFRWTYNLQFPEHTLLARYDFRSRGADQASTSNQHLHNYGLFCVPEMLRLWTYTKDDYYLDRTRDHIACFLQFIAREDGDFNAYKGMVTERFYNTNCFQPKGMMLTLSHSWCIGLILYAAQEAEAYADALKL
ncbi:hypothetical protein [Paenibacillus sacheonensis]|uniref:Uncharacterized protein n=1 Tax=Paenibacillus sacheonensis TaxID=742054 RepID=A0A7X5BZQ5_9BACL|nr:hypothetical protein [Paenibacillus sacheonensis]MBM7564044.1 hypothetical protein [Paenibacillus sacheonensis]NBC67624.1 hypothetical protein [Paenibacillus sacheonensis]